MADSSVPWWDENVVGETGGLSLKWPRGSNGYRIPAKPIPRPPNTPFLLNFAPQIKSFGCVPVRVERKIHYFFLQSISSGISLERLIVVEKRWRSLLRELLCDFWHLV